MVTQQRLIGNQCGSYVNIHRRTFPVHWD
ncbi:uncharacterized protein METZ01_LOCUS443638, partial [marine metagenome]